MKEDFDDKEPYSSSSTPSGRVTLKGLGAVRSSTASLIAQKLVSAAEAFESLHPTVKRDVVRLCDFVDNPFEFEEQVRFLCETNPFFLSQVSMLLEKRDVKAKIIPSLPDEEGWCVEDKLEDVFDPKTRSDVSLRVKKVSGANSPFSLGTVKTVPLRHILPYNLKR